MNDQELFELCKEVYERTGLGDTPDYVEERFVDGELVATDVCENVGYEEDDEVFEGVQRKHFPLYTSDYLLEKLPKYIMGTYNTQFTFNMDRPKSIKHKYRAFYKAPGYGHTSMTVADTPLKALLKLVIALDDVGVKL